MKGELFIDCADKSLYNPLIKKYSELISENLLVNRNLTDKEDSTENLSQIEFEVLKIAKDILKLKRYSAKFKVNSKSQIQKYPILEKLYLTCIAKLCYTHDYSKEEIFDAIQNLENRNWIISNQRRTKEEILNNEQYRVIINFIRQNPGIHASDKKIEAELNITRTTFLKYIVTLENFGLIRSTKFGKRLHFFLIEFPENFERLCILFLNPLVCKILIEFLKNSEVSIKQISRNLQLFPNAIQYHLKKLREANIVTIKIEGLNKHQFIINLPILEKYLQITRNDEISELANYILD